MEMKEILKELESKLEEAKTQQKDWEAKKAFWKAAVESAEKELNILNDDVSSLEMMIEAAKEGHFGNKEQAVTSVIAKDTEKEHPKEKQETEKKEPKQLDWKHKNAYVIKLNRYDNVEDRWRTQRAAAKGLNWDQSSVCKFMKLDKEQQLRKKGFALVWEY